MARSYYVTFWGQLRDQGHDGDRASGRYRWRWVQLYSCWRRRLSRLGRVWGQVEAWYGGIWRIQVSIERWETDGDGEWEPVEYL